MRKYEYKQVASKKKILVETTCDLCGKVAKHGNWDSSCYQVEETEINVTVRHKNGQSYPEGGWGEEYQIDMCPECFKEKLIPWIKTQGCDKDYEDWEW